MKATQSGKEAVLFSRIILIAFFVMLSIGTCLTYIFYFHEPYQQVSALEANDLLLDQEIYKETVSRLTKDMAEMQEQARIQPPMDEDIRLRIAKHQLLAQGLSDDIQQRVDGDQDLTDRLNQEIMSRSANDTLFQSRIDNATASLIPLQEFEQYSMDQFMIKMANITDITTEITAEIAARTAKDMTLMVQDTIIETALVLLITQLNNEMATREAIDNLLRMQLEVTYYGLFRTINGQSPVGGDIQLTSLGAGLVIINGPALDKIFISAPGIATFQGVGRSPVTGDVLFQGTNGITVDYPAANTIRFSGATGAVMGPNIARLSIVLPHGSNSRYINSMPNTFTTLPNALHIGISSLGCSSNTICTVTLGLPVSWTCNTALLGGIFSGCVLASGCVETDCNQLLGEPWHCRNDQCVQDYCTADIECSASRTWRNQAFPAGASFCINHVCSTGLFTGDTLPNFSQLDYTPNPGTSVAYMAVSQPRNIPFGITLCNNGCRNPEPGYQHLFNPITTRPPFPSWQGLTTTGCRFPQWDFQLCGFRVPGASQTYLVTATITIRVRISNSGRAMNAWFRMFMDRGYGWEPVDMEYVGLVETSSFANEYFYSYISMSTTMIFTSQPAGQVVPSLVIHFGWDGYLIDSESYSNNMLEASWWRITQDITQIA